MGCQRLTYHQKYTSKTESTPIFKMGRKQCSDYQVFGMQMPGRNGSTGDYRYGFQGQEKDDEVKGEGNSINYKYRMHDPRIGRFFAVDPLAAKFPHNGPYNFSENRVIDAFELEGLETITIEVAVRAIGPFVGASSFAGVGIGKDGLVAYAGYSAGLNFGLYGGAGIGAGFTMDDIGDFSGSSSEIGVAGGFKVAGEFALSFNPDTKSVGFGVAPGKLGVGIGGGVFLNRKETVSASITWEQLGEWIWEQVVSPNFGIDGTSVSNEERQNLINGVLNDE